MVGCCGHRRGKWGFFKMEFIYRGFKIEISEVIQYRCIVIDPATGEQEQTDWTQAEVKDALIDAERIVDWILAEREEGE